MVFSTLVPYLPFFTMIFFFFKYGVDKYNLSFVYNSEFQGTGIIKGRVVPFSCLNIIIYQIINVGFFAAKVPAYYEQFLVCGLVTVILEIIIIIALTAFNRSERTKKHLQKRKAEEKAQQLLEEHERRKTLEKEILKGNTLGSKHEELGGI